MGMFSVGQKILADQSLRCHHHERNGDMTLNWPNVMPAFEIVVKKP